MDQVSNEDRRCGRFAYAGLDRVIHERARLSVLTSLVAHPKGLLFADLKQLCALTDGNLSRHLQVLQEAKLVEVLKGFNHNRPQTENLYIEGTPGETLPPKPVPTYKGQGDIYGDFIECVKTREKPFRDIESAVNTAVLAHLGNIAYQLKRSLKWDSARQEFVNDTEANRLVDRARREPWQL